MTSFNDLGLLPDLLRSVTDEGYSTPTPVQAQAIPAVLAGQDLAVIAQTGTGKTASFTLPILQRLAEKQGARALRVLILAPTRELAAQIGESVRTYSKYMRGIKSTVVFGGVSMNTQVQNLRHGVDIVIATPGRLLDHIGQRTVDLSKIETLVLDEADRMFDMGFIDAIRKILQRLPKQRQNLLFSATFPDPVKELADQLLNAPKMIEVSKRNTPAAEVSHTIYPVDTKRKRDLLFHLISSQNWKRALVFTRTKHGANRLSLQLEKDGITSMAIHGNKSQAARTKALHDFKEGKLRVLVATDIAARGIDIEELPYVVNFDLPFVPEDYVHRIGRTGRAGNKGNAISLVSVDERSLLRDIERLLKQPIPQVVVPGYEPDPSIKPVPIPNGRGGGGGNFYGRKRESRGRHQGGRSFNRSQNRGR